MPASPYILVFCYINFIASQSHSDLLQLSLELMNVPMHILVRHKVVGRLLIHSHNSKKDATESTVNVMFDDRREDRAYAVSFCSLLGRACQSGASQIFMRMQQLD